MFGLTGQLKRQAHVTLVAWVGFFALVVVRAVIGDGPIIIALVVFGIGAAMSSIIFAGMYVNEGD